MQWHLTLLLLALTLHPIRDFFGGVNRFTDYAKN